MPPYPTQKAFKMIRSSNSSHELSSKRAAALLAYPLIVDRRFLCWWSSCNRPWRPICSRSFPDGHVLRTQNHVRCSAITPICRWWRYVPIRTSFVSRAKTSGSLPLRIRRPEAIGSSSIRLLRMRLVVWRPIRSPGSICSASRASVHGRSTL